MPEIQPLPTAATDPTANLERGNPRFGWGSTLPLPAHFVIVTVGWWGLGVLLQLIEHPSRVDAFYLVLRAVFALVLGGVLTAITASRQRRNGGREAVRAMHAAVRTGDLPAGADRATWEPALAWRARQLRRSRWLTPIFCALFAAIGLVLAVVDPREVAVGVITAVLFAGVGVWQEVLAARQLPHIRSLEQQLGGAGR